MHDGTRTQQSKSYQAAKARDFMIISMDAGDGIIILSFGRE
jgi:hypothetical protein